MDRSVGVVAGVEVGVEGGGEDFDPCHSAALAAFADNQADVASGRAIPGVRIKEVGGLGGWEGVDSEFFSFTS